MASVLEPFRYCFLRDGECEQKLNGATEWDLLIDPRQRKPLIEALEQMGFVEMPSFGYAPHRFLLTYDATCHRWLKLDIVDRLAWGYRYPVFHSQLAAITLDRRRKQDGRWIPQATHEWIGLLLHGILDKRSFSPARRERIVQLTEQIQGTNGDELAKECQSAGVDLARFLRPWIDWIRSENWDGLLRDGPALEAHLSRGHIPFGRRRTRSLDQLVQRCARKLGRVVHYVRPSTPVVALLAPDGAGKSSLIARWTRASAWPTTSVYFGLYQRQAPSRSAATRHRFPALIARSWVRYLEVRRKQAHGQIVLCDRYITDARLPQTGKRQPWKRLRRWLLGHCCPLPERTFILDAPGSVLFERKGEHTIEWLEQQRHHYRQLAHSLPHTQIISANRPVDDVHRELSQLIWDWMRTRNGRVAR